MTTTELTFIRPHLPGANRIASVDEALEAAAEFAAYLRCDASKRDAERRLPGAELDAYSCSGLLALSVPREFGGPGFDVATIAEVFRIVSSADASVGQIPHSHMVFLEALRLQGTARQKEFYFGEVLNGARLANAQAERGGKTAADDSTTLRRDGDGYVLDGEKFYCTGALYAHYLVVRAVDMDAPGGADGARPKLLVFLPSATPGVTVVDDWDGMGQRTTASGTVRLDGVRVPASAVVPFTPLFSGPTTYGARAQVLHAAIDVGIARGALDAGVHAVAKARPWFESGVDRAADDPLVVQQAGELEIQLRGAESLLRDAARTIADAERDLTERSTATASLATAVAKVVCDRASMTVASALFELGGTRAASGALNLSRFWRDARTHTLHDPARWKVQHIGRWVLDGTPPPRHGQL